eukprot:1759476-Rhodomonas_salina.3
MPMCVVAWTNTQSRIPCFTAVNSVIPLSSSLGSHILASHAAGRSVMVRTFSSLVLRYTSAGIHTPSRLRVSRSSSRSLHARMSSLSTGPTSSSPSMSSAFSSWGRPLRMLSSLKWYSRLSRYIPWCPSGMTDGASHIPSPCPPGTPRASLIIWPCLVWLMKPASISCIAASITTPATLTGGGIQSL